jgi:hypothetical protein
VFELFAGDRLVFLLKNVRGNASSKIINVTLEGVLLDECETFFYIGATDEKITGAIPKDSVASMIIGDMSVEDDIEIPEGFEEH